MRGAAGAADEAAPADRLVLGEDRAGRAGAAATGGGARRSAHRANPTPELNRFLADVVATTPPPARRGGGRLRLYYIAQIETSPPRFAVQVNDRRLISRSGPSTSKTGCVTAYGLDGVPLIIDFVPVSGAKV